MNPPIFVTGIGTGVGKTVISAILTEALEANYWKPIQAGFDDGTDKQQVKSLITNNKTVFFEEVYTLNLPASPHIAARAENISINTTVIKESFKELQNKFANTNVIIEGAGGLLVPINEREFVLDIIKSLQAKVVLVSRNYLGSINHSLLTAEVCKMHNLDVLGWVFNDQFMHYEEEIVGWSGYKKIASIPLAKNLTKEWVKQQANSVRQSLK